MIQFEIFGYVITLHWGIIASVVFLFVCLIAYGIRDSLLRLFGAESPHSPFTAPNIPGWQQKLLDRSESAVGQLFPTSADGAAEREQGMTWVLLLLAIPMTVLEFIITKFALTIMFPGGELDNWAALGLVFALLACASLAFEKISPSSNTSISPRPYAKLFWGLVIVTTGLGLYATYWVAISARWPLIVLIPAVITGGALRGLICTAAAWTGSSPVRNILSPLITLIMAGLTYAIARITHWFIHLISYIFTNGTASLRGLLLLFIGIGGFLVSLIRRFFSMRIRRSGVTLLCPISEQVLGESFQVEGKVASANSQEVKLYVKSGRRLYEIQSIPIQADGSFTGMSTMKNTNIPGNVPVRLRAIAGRRKSKYVRVRPTATGFAPINAPQEPAKLSFAKLLPAWMRSLLPFILLISLIPLVTGCKTTETEIPTPSSGSGPNNMSTQTITSTNNEMTNKPGQDNLHVFVLIDQTGSWWSHSASDAKKLSDVAKIWLAEKLLPLLRAGDEITFVSVGGARSGSDEEVLINITLPGTPGRIDPIFLTARNDLETKINSIGLATTGPGSDPWGSLDHLADLSTKTAGGRNVVFCMTDYIVDEDPKHHILPPDRPTSTFPTGVQVISLFVPRNRRTSKQWSVFKQGIQERLNSMGAATTDIFEPAESEKLNLASMLGRTNQQLP